MKHVLVVISSAALSAAALAQPFTYTWNLSPDTFGLWSEPDNWTGNEPNGRPSSADTAIFVNGGRTGDGAANNLQLQNQTLTLRNGNNFDAITNNGVITFETTTGAVNGPDHRLQVRKDSTIGGTGTLNLTTAEHAISRQAAPVPTLTQLAGHTISVTLGEFTSLIIDNRGTITVPGELLLSGTEVNSTSGGAFNVAGWVRNSSATIRGVISSVGSAARLSGIVFAALENITINGAFQIGEFRTPLGGIDQVQSTLRLTTTSDPSTITNNATLTFVQDSFDDDVGSGDLIDQQLTLPFQRSVVNLGGTGEIVLNGSQTGIANAGTINHLSPHEITTTAFGGRIEGGTINNSSLIEAANSGELALGSIVNNTGGGQIQVSANGALALTGATIQGGTVTGGIDAQLLVRSSTNQVRDLTLGGLFALRLEQSSANLQLAGTVTNNATITFSNATTGALGLDQTLVVFYPGAALLGNGSFIFNGAESGLSPRFNSVLTHGPDHTLTTRPQSPATTIGGQIEVAVINQGTIEANSSELRITGNPFNQTASGELSLINGQIELPTNTSISGDIVGNGTIEAAGQFTHSDGMINPDATITFTHVLNLSADSVLDIELNAPGTSDVVNVGVSPNSGNLRLDGVVNLTAGPGFVGTSGDTYTIIDYAGTLTDNGLTIGNKPNGLDVVITNNPAQRTIQVSIQNAPPILFSVASRKVHQ